MAVVGDAEAPRGRHLAATPLGPLAKESGVKGLGVQGLDPYRVLRFRVLGLLALGLKV